MSNNPTTYARRSPADDSEIRLVREGDGATVYTFGPGGEPLDQVTLDAHQMRWLLTAALPALLALIEFDVKARQRSAT